MYINDNYKIKKENWSLRDTFKFINTCLIAYERIYIKDQNKLVCYEEEFDTLDFNEVPYLLRNEFEIPEYLVKEIKKLEFLIKQLYIEKEIIGQVSKNNIIFLLNYEGTIYNIVYDGNIMTYSKSKIKVNNDFIIDFENIYKLVNGNIKTI